MLLTIILFLGSAVLIYLACEYFVNGVEWVGHGFRFSQTATGTILAAFGTALPESVVTFVAVAFGTSAAERDIGVGAALGGPLVLSTLGYAVVGAALLAGGRMKGALLGAADIRGLRQDQIWFLAIFVFKLGLGLVAFAGKGWLGLLFLAAYGVYVAKELKEPERGADSALEPLKIQPRTETPALGWALLQTATALAVILVASRVFVLQLDAIGPALGIPPQLTALLLSPVATEMPEIMNALIWVRQGRERMALANISGAMMIQATIPSALGLLFTPWRFQTPSIVAAAMTALAVAALVILLRREPRPRDLILPGVFYAAFAAVVIYLGV